MISQASHGAARDPQLCWWGGGLGNPHRCKAWGAPCLKPLNREPHPSLAENLQDGPTVLLSMLERPKRKKQKTWKSLRYSEVSTEIRYPFHFPIWNKPESTHWWNACGWFFLWFYFSNIKKKIGSSPNITEFGIPLRIGPSAHEEPVSPTWARLSQLLSPGPPCRGVLQPCGSRTLPTHGNLHSHILTRCYHPSSASQSDGLCFLQCVLIFTWNSLYNFDWFRQHDKMQNVKMNVQKSADLFKYNTRRQVDLIPNPYT